MDKFKINIEKKKSFRLININKEICESCKIEDKQRRNILIYSDNRAFELNGWFSITSDGQISIPKKLVVELEDYKSKGGKELNVKIIDIPIKDFYRYYLKYKGLAILHRELKFGNGSRLAENFTEGLCRKIFELYKIEGKKYDAIDDEGNLIEIKASISSSGEVTINPSIKFDLLYWLYLDLDTDTLIIRKDSYKSFEKFLEDNKNNSRVSIKLEKFMKNAKKHQYKFNEEMQEIT